MAHVSIMLLRSTNCRFIVLGCLAFSGSAAAEPIWELETYGYYATGRYEQQARSEWLYIPLVVKCTTPDWRASLTVPYLYIKEPSAEPTLQDTPDSTRHAVSGIGDVVLKITRELVEQNHAWPWISAFTRLKWPTASESKNLGTGEVDMGFGLESVRSFEHGLLGFLDIGYTFVGNPDHAEYRNTWSASTGVGYTHRSALLLAAFYEWRQAASRGRKNPSQLSFLTSRRLTPDWRIFSMWDLGLNEAAPDFGLAAGLSRRL